ncbi:MAG: DotA/TraY family protein [Rhodospirillales bacterium]|nr:DotA/TraY family protein [Rhodospirillales bacterium]
MARNTNSSDGSNGDASRRPSVFGRVVGELFAARATVANIRVPLSLMAGSARRTAGYLSSVVMRTPGKRFHLDGIDEAHERFEEALRQSGNAMVLDRMHAAINRRFELWTIAALLFFTFGLMAAAPAGPVHEFVLGDDPTGVHYALILALPFLLSAHFLSRAARWSFWSYQISSRRLCGPLEWFRKPSCWVPGTHKFGTAAKLLIVGAVSSAVIQHTGIGIHEALAQSVSSQNLGSLAGTSAGPAPGSTNIIESLFGALAQNDLSFSWMVRLFPSYFNAQSGVSYQSDAVAQMFNVINASLLGLGTIVLTWHTVYGLFQTAHDGQFLGNRWHSAMAPIRIGMGIAGTVPIKGFCAAQIIIIKVFLAGFGLGNMIWSTYVGAATGQTAGIVSVTVPPMTMNETNTFNAIVSSASCYEAARYFYRPAAQPGAADGPLQDSQMTSVLAPERGWSGARPLFQDPILNTSSAASSPVTTGLFDFGQVCGGVQLPQDNLTTYQTDAQRAASSVVQLSPYQSGRFGNFVTQAQQKSGQQGLQTTTGAETAFLQARNQAFFHFVQQMMSSPYITDVAAGNVPGGVTLQGVNLVSYLSQIRGDYAQYEQAVLKAAGQMQAKLNSTTLKDLALQSVTLGWASAGAMEPQILSQEVNVDNLVSEKPTIIPVNMDALGDTVFPGIEQKVADETTKAEDVVAYGSIGSIESSNLAGAGSTGIALTGSSQLDTSLQKVAVTRDQMISEAKKDPTNFLSAIGKYNGSMLERYLIGISAADPINPIGEISNTGVWVKGLGYGVFATYEGALFWASSAKAEAGNTWVGNITSFFSGGVTTAGTSGLAAVMKSMALLVDALGLWLVTVGIAMEYLIPMLGYTIWISALAVFMLFIVEAVAGAPFWSFSHIRADGQDLVNQEQSYGWKIIPVAILYPSMMVVGLVLANVAMSAIINLVNHTFLVATNAIGAVYDPFGLAAVLSILFGIYYNVIQRSYRLITWIPEWVMSWMGSSGVNRGDGHGEGVGIVDKTRQGGEGQIREMGSRFQGGMRRQGEGRGGPGGMPGPGGPSDGEGGPIDVGTPPR